MEELTMTENQRQIGHDQPIDIDFDDKSEIADDDKRVEDEILREFNADGEEKEWRITVKKVEKRSGKMATCFILSPEEIGTIFNRLNSEFGPGTYRAFVSCNGKLTRNLEYRIAERIAVPATPIQSSPINDVAAMLKTHTDQLAAIMQGQAPSQTPPVDWVKRIPEIMAAVASAKTIFAPPPVKDNTELFFRMFELAKDMNGGGDSSSNMYDVIRELMKSPLGESAAQQLANYNPNQKALPQPVAQGPINVEIQDNPRPPQVTQPPAILASLPPGSIEPLRNQVLMWTDRAKAESDPALYADLALDNYDAEMLQYIVDLPDLSEIIVYFSPDAAQFMAWFQSLISEIKSGLTQDIDAGDKGNSTGLIQPEAVTVNALEKRPATVAGTTPANAHGDTERRSGNSGNAKDNAPASTKRKKTTPSKTTGVVSDKKLKTKRPARGN